MISEEDKDFLKELFSEELSAENMDLLDVKLKTKEFRDYYDQQLDQNYSDNKRELFIKYIPMLILVILILLGLYLISFFHGN